MYPPCPSDEELAEAGPTFVKAYLKLQKLGFVCKESRPIWIGEVECGKCVDERGINKLVIACYGSKGCKAEKRTAVPAEEVLLHAADYAVLKAVKEIVPRLPDSIVPRYLKAFVERLDIDEPPPDFSPEVLIAMLKSGEAEKKSKRVKKNDFPFFLP